MHTKNSVSQKVQQKYPHSKILFENDCKEYIHITEIVRIKKRFE